MKEVTENRPVPMPPEYHEMDVRLVQVEAILPTLATKSDVAELRADMHKMEVLIVRWTVATVIGLFVGFSGMFFAMQSNTNSRIASLEDSTKSRIASLEDMFTRQQASLEGMFMRQHGLLNPAPAVDPLSADK